MGLAVVMFSGCAQNLALTSHNKGLELRESTLFARLQAHNWPEVMEVVAHGDAQPQQSLLASLQDEVVKTPDLNKQLQIGFLLAYGSREVRDEVKAVKIYRDINSDPKSELLQQDPWAAFALNLLGDLENKHKKMWVLGSRQKKLEQENKEMQDYIAQLENKLKAIKSIEESIHKRSR